MSPNDEDKTMMALDPGAGAGGSVEQASTSVPPPAKLVCLDDSLLEESQRGLEIVLSDSEVTIGRNPNNNTQPLFNKKVSSTHARIFVGDGWWGVEDFGSSNGVWINGTRQTAQTRLRSGDTLKIGVVPFLYVLDRPEGIALDGDSEPEDEDEGAGTLMFNDVRATDRLLQAEEEVQAQPEAHKPPPPPKRSAPSVTSRDKSSAPKKSGSKIIILILLLLVAGGGYFAWENYLKPPAGLEKVPAHQKAVKGILQDYEDVPGSVGIEELKKQLDKIRVVSNAVNRDADQFPLVATFKDLQAQLLFLRLERQLSIHIQEGQVEKGQTLIAKAKDEVALLKTEGLENASDKFIPEVKALLDLASHVAVIKKFRQAYPSPSSDAASKPSSQDIANFDVARDGVVRQVKTPLIHTALQVRYLFFERMIAIVVNEDMLLMEQWKRLRDASS